MNHTSQSFAVTIILYSALLGVLFFGWQNIEQSSRQSANKALPITLNMFQVREPVKPTGTQPDDTPIKPQPSIKEPIPPAIEEPPVKPVVEVTPEQKTVNEKPVAAEPVKPKPVKKMPAKPVKPVIEKAAEKTPPRITEEQPIKEKPVEQQTITEKNFQPNDQPLTPIKPTVVDTTPVKHLTATQIEQAEQRYLLELRQQIVRFAEDTYPRLARRRHWQGQVLLEIVILPNGTIDSVKIIKDSKHHLLDQAALEIFTLRMKNRFKPFPEDIQRRIWTIKVPVNYRLY